MVPIVIIINFPSCSAVFATISHYVMCINVWLMLCQSTVYDCLVGTCTARIVCHVMDWCWAVVPRRILLLSCDGLMLGCCAKTYFVVVILVMVCCSLLLIRSCKRVAFVYLCWLCNWHLCYSVSTLINNYRITTTTTTIIKIIITIRSSDNFVCVLFYFRACNVHEIVISKLSSNL